MSEQHPSRSPTILSRDELRDLFCEVIDTKLEAIGIDVKDPKQTRRDLEALREFREWWDDFKREAAKKSLIAVLLLLVGGAGTLLALGLRAWMKSPTP